MCTYLKQLWLFNNNIQTLPSDFFAGGAVGSLAGIGGTAAVAGTLITTWLVPVMTANGYAPIFALAAGIVPLGVLAVWLLGPLVKASSFGALFWLMAAIAVGTVAVVAWLPGEGPQGVPVPGASPERVPSTGSAGSG